MDKKDHIEHNYAASETEYKNFLLPSLKSAISFLNLTENDFLLDAGCGPGATFLPLLEGAKFKGRIIGIDGSKTHLEAAKELIEKHGIQENVSLVQHNLFDRLPFGENTFDLVWFSDVLFPDDTGIQTLSMLAEAKRVLKPGGRIAILYGNWLRLHLLEGYSMLENIISMANEQRKSGLQEWIAALHPENGMQWLMESGMIDCNTSFHDTTYFAPLPGRIENYILWHFRNIYTAALKFYSESSRDKELLQIFENITDPASTEYLLKKPWYYCRASPILFVGRKS